MVLECPFVVLVCPLVVLVCPLVVSVYPLVVLVVLYVGLFITDRLHGIFVLCIEVFLLTNQKKNVLISSLWETIPTQSGQTKIETETYSCCCDVYMQCFH